MFFAFASALVISSAISLVIIVGRRMVAPTQQYDFAALNSNVGLIDEPAVADD